MAETTKMDKIGCITIPKKMRNAHGLDEGVEFIIEDIDDETFILKKIDLNELISHVKEEIKGKDIEKLNEEVEEEADEIAKVKFSS